MRLRNRTEELGPDAERELDAIERGLAGEPVDPDLSDLSDWAELSALLSDERPTADEDWGAELDARVERRFRTDGPGSPLDRVRAWFEGRRPVRALAPAGALATLAIVAVVGVSSIGDSDGQQEGGDSSMSSVEQQLTVPEESSQDSGSGGVAEAPASSSGDVNGLGSPARPLRDNRTAKVAPGVENRKVDRDVALELSTRPDEVREVSDEVISITRSLDGVVATSQVSEAGRSSEATLQLVIPTRNLDSAIDRLTEVANVESLNEATTDITKPYVSAQDRVADARAERRQLLEALGNASSDDEAKALRKQIADARREISRAQSRFDNISRRANLSNVAVTVSSNPDAAEERSMGDWLDDALDVLGTIGGVLLISAAIVLPLGILLALAWVIGSRVRGRRRERALD